MKMNSSDVVLGQGGPRQPRLFSSGATQCSAEMIESAAGSGGGNQRQGGPNLDKGNREHPDLGRD